MAASIRPKSLLAESADSIARGYAYEIYLTGWGTGGPGGPRLRCRGKDVTVACELRVDPAKGCTGSPIWEKWEMTITDDRARMSGVYAPTHSFFVNKCVFQPIPVGVRVSFSFAADTSPATPPQAGD